MTSETHHDRDVVSQMLRDAVLQPECVVSLATGELDLMLRIARRARLLGRLGVALEACGVLSSLPAIAVDQLTSAMILAESRSRLAAWELDRIRWALGAQHQPPLVILKGCAYSLMNLPNSSGRSFADVDLLTTQEALKRVEATLNEKGWETRALTPYDQNYYRKWTHELPPLVHVEREVEVDLHHNILPRTARLHPPASKLLESARMNSDSSYYILCNEDMVLHAIVHLFFDSDLSDKFRDLVDIVDLISHFSSQDEGFWNQLISRSDEMGLGRPTYYALRYGKLLLKLGVPEETRMKCRKWAPPTPVRVLMDCLVPRALLPVHPDRVSRSTAFSRLLLFTRSHWIRMPPWLLSYHLTYKFLFARIVSRRAGANGNA